MDQSLNSCEDASECLPDAFAPDLRPELSVAYYDVSWQGRPYLVCPATMEKILSSTTARIRSESMRFVETLKQFQSLYCGLKTVAECAGNATASAALEPIAETLRTANAFVGRLIGMAYGATPDSLLSAFRLLRPISAGLNRAAAELNAFTQRYAISLGHCESINVCLSGNVARLIPRVLGAPLRKGGVNTTRSEGAEIARLVSDETGRGAWVSGGRILRMADPINVVAAESG